MAVPLTNVRVSLLGATVPGAHTAPEQTTRVVHGASSYLPPLERLLYYGGLGTAAVVGVVEWPVAVAVDAGVWVATRGRRSAGVASEKRHATVANIAPLVRHASGSSIGAHVAPAES
jgi:hypothetical protein